MTSTSISIVIDRSGSMAGREEATIGAVNTYLMEARSDHALSEASISILTFDSQSIDIVRHGTVRSLRDLTRDDFVPRGLTPLYDAIGRGVEQISANMGPGKNERGILVVITDGEENSSRKHNHSSISELLQSKQAEGWLVVFLGADLSTAQQGTKLGLNAGLVACATFSEAGMASAMRSVSGHSVAYAATQDFGDYASNASFSEAERAEMASGEKDDPSTQIKIDAWS